MTMQASEIIEYRGEQYSLFANPLDSYLETRKDLSFEKFSTVNWRGYQGYWKLEKGNLYLTSIESANHTVQSIFQTSEPVLAKWFSGNMEFGFGEKTIIECYSIYENRLWLKVENGIVIDKKITKYVEHDPQITFGKYIGKRISDVIQGKINSSSNRGYLLKTFIGEIINFFCDEEYGNKIDVPFFNITDETKLTVNDIKQTTVNYLLTSNYVAIEKYFYINSTGEEDTEKFSKLLEEILVSDFAIIRTLSKKDFAEAAIAENTFLINGDINYLEWAINKIENFSIPPHQICEKDKHKYLRKFQINRLNSTIFEYKPVIEDVSIKFKEDIKKNNIAKFQKKFGVLYDSTNDIYVYDLAEEELFNRFGYYLDENCEAIEDEQDNDGERHDYQEKDYSDYERDYFDAMTDGQLGDYDDFHERGGNIDDVDTWARG